jgi:hypothetical protein
MDATIPLSTRSSGVLSSDVDPAAADLLAM